MPDAFDHLQEEFTIRVDSSAVLSQAGTHCLTAGIDCGTELIKIVYSTEAADGEGSCRLHFALFESRHIEAALGFLKLKLGQLKPADEAKGRLRVTGNGVCLHGDKMKEMLGVDLKVVDEAASQCRGLHFLLTSSTDDFCHPPPAFDEAEFAGIQRGETFERYREAQVALMSEQSLDSPFPCLLVVYGSNAGIYMINEDGSLDVKYRNQVAGKSFLGLCQLLIGTSDYAEIMRLAAAGKRGNIDTQIRDILAESPDSPYGRMPQSLPLFAFGKAVDFDKSLEETRREDVAQSLVSSFTANVTYPATQLATFGKIRHVYFGGGFFRDEFPRLEVVKCSKLFAATDAMNLKFLRIGHLAALGAMLHTSGIC